MDRLTGTTVLFCCLFTFVHLAGAGLERDDKTTLFELADSLMIEMDYKGAEKVYKNVLKRDKESLAALKGLAELNIAKRDWGDVKKWAKNVLKITPDDLDAHYYLGIANRETGRAKGLFLKNKDFGTSEKHFQIVLDANSKHRDVLYQRGRLEHRRQNWLSAFEWGWQQIQVNPEQANAGVGFYKLARLFLRYGTDDEVQNVLDDYSGDWMIYLSAEKLRRENNFTAADSVLQALLASDPTMHRTPIYLSLIRINAEQNNDDKVNEYYWQALDEVVSFSDLLFFYEDAKYVFTVDEWRDFRTLADVPDQKIFFREFWAARDPIPASPNDYGMIEHYRRLVRAEDDFWFDGHHSLSNDPDVSNFLRFPDTYYLNQEFNDKGVVYIRQGEPSDIARTAEAGQNESWRYYGSGERPAMVLHFVVIGSAAPGNWRLTPTITNRTVLDDRLGWDSSITNVYHSRSALDYTSNINEMGRRSERAVTQALTTCYYSGED